MTMEANDGADDGAQKAADDAAMRAATEAAKRARDEAANISAQKGKISAALERALFVRFWTWLAAVFVVVVPVISGIAIGAVYTVQFIEKSRIEALADQAQKVEEGAINSLREVAIKSGEATGAADEARRQSASARQLLEQLKSQIDASKSAAELINQLGALSTNGDFIQKTTASLVSSQDFTRAISSRITSFVPIRFGQRGSSENGGDTGEPFVQLPQPGPQKFAASADFPVCALTEIRVGQATGQCQLTQVSGQWAVVVTGYFACGVTCFKTAVRQ